MKTVPVRLLRAQNDRRKQHDDAHFAAATVRYHKDIATLLGEDVVAAESQDNKVI